MSLTEKLVLGRDAGGSVSLFWKDGERLVRVHGADWVRILDELGAAMGTPIPVKLTWGRFKVQLKGWVNDGSWFQDVGEMPELKTNLADVFLACPGAIEVRVLDQKTGQLVYERRKVG